MKRFSSILGVLFVILISYVVCTSCSKSEETPIPITYNGEEIQYEIYYEFGEEYREDTLWDYSYLDIIIAFPSKGEELVISLADSNLEIAKEYLTSDFFISYPNRDEIYLDTGTDYKFSIVHPNIKITGDFKRAISITGLIHFTTDEGSLIILNYNGPIERRENTDS